MNTIELLSVPVVKETVEGLTFINQGYIPLTDTLRLVINGKFYDVIEFDPVRRVRVCWDLSCGEIVEFPESF